MKLYPVAFFSFQDSQGTKDALKGIQSALVVGQTAKPGGTGGLHSAAVMPIYNITRVKRVKVAVPLETCAIAQQTVSKRDVQVGLPLIHSPFWESGCQRRSSDVKNVKCLAARLAT